MLLLKGKVLIHNPLGETGAFGLARYFSLQSFFPIAGVLIPWFAAGALVFCTAGLYTGLFLAPTDAHQGEVYRIMFIHVPAAWISMFIYLVMAVWAALGWVSGARLPAIMAQALAPTGALFTFLALWSGSLWGKPAWGTWWVWDARLTSELVLMFSYAGFMVLRASTAEPRLGEKLAAALVLAGVPNIPFYYLSGRWWNTLHQDVSVGPASTAGVEATMLMGILAMTVGLWMYSTAVGLARVRCVVLEDERDSDWVARHVRSLR